jgi:hypothetical protein
MGCGGEEVLPRDRGIFYAPVRRARQLSARFVGLFGVNMVRARNMPVSGRRFYSKRMEISERLLLSTPSNASL